MTGFLSLTSQCLSTDPELRPLQNLLHVIPSVRAEALNEAKGWESDFSFIISHIATSSCLNGTPRDDLYKGLDLILLQ